MARLTALARQAIASRGDAMVRKRKPENHHAAVSRRDCEKMGKRNGWNLMRVEPTGDPILKANCVFEGEQTSFEDERLKDD